VYFCVCSLFRACRFACCGGFLGALDHHAVRILTDTQACGLDAATCRCVDKLDVPIKVLIIGLYLTQAASILFFLVAVYLPGVFGAAHALYWPVFGACIAQGVFNAGIGPLSYELGAEIAYPVGEETSATFLAVLGNLLYIFAMQLIGDRVSSRVFNWVTIATLVVGAALMLAIRGKGGRSKVDEGKTQSGLVVTPRLS
jgi:MFS family permease